MNKQHEQPHNHQHSHTQKQTQQHYTKIHYKSLFIQYKPIKLILHRNFNTAHSSSATRTNFFIRVGSQRPQIYCKQHIYGFGQAGLPPKKPGCYMADIQDCLTFMTKLHQDISAMNHNKYVHAQQQQKHVQQNPSNLYPQLHMPLKLSERVIKYNTSLRRQIFELLNIIQKYNKIDEFRAAKCALQFALLDIFGKYHQVCLSQLLNIQQKTDHQYSYSFYTASLQSHQNMLNNIRQHTKMTKFIKIKYNNDIDGLLQLLKQIKKKQETQQEFKCIKKYIIDANCSWSCSDFKKFITGVQQIDNNFMNKILYIEQPFDLNISDSQNWSIIKKVSPIKILADESFRNYNDISIIKPVCDAVNIKTQKTGGPFATLHSVLLALQSGLQVMFGSMCSTQLGCAQTFQFYPYAQYLDIDGALLVKQPQVIGGFIWEQDGKVIHAKHTVQNSNSNSNNSHNNSNNNEQQKKKYQTGWGLNVDANFLFNQKYDTKQ